MNPKHFGISLTISPIHKLTEVYMVKNNYNYTYTLMKLGHDPFVILTNDNQWPSFLVAM